MLKSTHFFSHLHVKKDGSLSPFPKLEHLKWKQKAIITKTHPVNLGRENLLLGRTMEQTGQKPRFFCDRLPQEINWGT